MDEFIDTEYTKRQDLFALAVLTVDVAGLTKQVSARRVVDALLRTREGELHLPKEQRTGFWHPDAR